MALLDFRCPMSPGMRKKFLLKVGVEDLMDCFGFTWSVQKPPYQETAQPPLFIILLQICDMTTKLVINLLCKAVM